MKCESYAGGGGVISPRTRGLKMANSVLSVAVELLISNCCLRTRQDRYVRHEGDHYNRAVLILLGPISVRCHRLKYLHATGHGVNP